MIIEVFRAGKQTDSDGNDFTFSEEHLDGIVTEHNGRGTADRAGFAAGHPEDDGKSPRYATVGNMFRKGKSLFAEVVDLVPEMADALKKKMFTNVSISIDKAKDGLFKLRHIAFLGATPPAVKGLAGLAFKEKDSAVYEFSFSEKGDVLTKAKDALKSLKEFFDFKDDSEPKTPKDDEKINMNQNQNGGLTMDEKEIQAMKDENSDLKAKNTDLEKKFNDTSEEVKTIKTKMENDRAEVKANEYSAWVDTQVKANKLTPAEKPAVLTMLKTLDGQEAMDYSEGGNTVKKTPIDYYKGTIENGPERVDFSEAKGDKLKLKNGETAGDKLDVAAREYQKENKCSYPDAFRFASNQNPELSKLYSQEMLAAPKEDK